MSEHNLLGNEGEEKASEFLEGNGYKIVHKNWRAGHLELDIIAEFQNRIVFVEVKCRSGNYFQEPFEAVNRKKQRSIIKAANFYIHRFNIDLEARFDIISIVKKNNTFEIEHIEDAFYPLV